MGGPSERPGLAERKRVEAASLRDEPLPPHPRHPIAIEPGSRLSAALGTCSADADSFHHQAVDRLAPGLAVTARSPDGVVEAVETADPDHWVLAMQCELHEEWRVDPAYLGVFEHFVKAAEDHLARG